MQACKKLYLRQVILCCIMTVSTDNHQDLRDRSFSSTCTATESAIKVTSDSGSRDLGVTWTRNQSGPPESRHVDQL